MQAASETSPGILSNYKMILQSALEFQHSQWSQNRKRFFPNDIMTNAAQNFNC